MEVDILTSRTGVKLFMVHFVMSQNFSWLRYTVVKRKQTSEQKDRQT
jgi:hypothetical protein